MAPTKTRALSMDSLLEPWVELFAKYGHAKVNHTTKKLAHGVSRQLTTVEFVLSALAEQFVGREDVAALREALEVLYAATLVDVRAVEQALSGLCYHDVELQLDDSGGEEAEEEPVPEDEPVVTNKRVQNDEKDREVEFVVTLHGVQGRFLERVVGPVLFTDQAERSEVFMATSRAIVGEYTASRMPPVCRVNVVSMDGSFLDEPEDDYVERVVSFIEQLDGLTKQAAPNATGISISAVDVEFNELALTPQVVDAVARLRGVSIPVHCSRIAINPHRFACTAQVLTTFLDCLGHQSSSLTVEIGHVAMFEPMACMDEDGASREQLIHTIFSGIAGSSCVTGVSFGPLLAQVQTPGNRKAVWRELFQTLLAKNVKARVSSLTVSPQICLLDEDASYIAETFVHENTSIYVKTIALWLSDSSPDAVQAFVKAVGANIESLTLHNEASTLTSADTISSVMMIGCPNLRVLSLTSAEVESMALFTDRSTPLQSLALSSVVVKDTSSVVQFFSLLADPRSPLAKTMVKLHIKSDNNTEDSLLMDESTLEVVALAMTNNKTLRDIELTVADDVPTALVAQIQRHDREVLADPLSLAQQLSFLSVVQPSATLECCSRSRVDVDVVRHVFALAADRVTRRVFIDW